MNAMDMRKIDTATATPLGSPEPAPKRGLRTVLMLALPLLLIAAGAWYFLAGAGTVSTDNAYVRQDKVSISPDVTGRIVEVAVAENQTVKAGDLLFRIDSAPYAIALEQADASLASARLQVRQLRTGLTTKAVDIGGAQEGVGYAQRDFARQAELLKEGFTTRARYDEAVHTLQQARDGLSAARAETANAAAALGDPATPTDRHPLVLAALAQRDKAKLELSRTEVRAPSAGIVSQTGRLQVGNIAASGLPLVSIVRSGKAWVDANFKETDLEAMRVGQRATVRLDAYGDRKLAARVASIGAGTGSEFSVLPAQNASGNWVKVTQRVPVRIEFTETPARELIAGLSAKVTVETGD